MTPGAYVVGDPGGPVAVCTLTSNELMAPCARVPGVAIAGRVYTVNLGIEKIVRNVTANPRIRFLLLCGRESPVFHPGQGLRALLDAGITAERRIVGALGHLPVLDHLPAGQIEAFRRQVELVDRTGMSDPAQLATEVARLRMRHSAPFRGARAWEGAVPAEPHFKVLPPGGGGRPIEYDPKGFIVITLDREAGQIVARHYWLDHRSGHEVRARTAEGILQSLLRHELVSQPSHAGYLGVELARAEAALRLGLQYEQDQPLKDAPPG